MSLLTLIFALFMNNQIKELKKTVLCQNIGKVGVFCRNKENKGTP